MVKPLLALLALTSVAHADGPLTVEAGPTAVMLDTPNMDSDAFVGVAITAGLRIDKALPVGFRLHASVGRDGAGLRVFGAGWHRESAKLVIDAGGGIADVVGPANENSATLRPRGIGLALDVRVGYVVGPVIIAAFALPTWVFASDATASEARLRSAVEAGISLGKNL